MIKKFANINFMINPAFLQKEAIDAPILGQVNLLLEGIADKGDDFNKKNTLSLMAKVLVVI